MSSRLTDKEVEALLLADNPKKKTLSEDVGHRGAGRLIVKKLSGGAVEFRFKYYRDRKTPVEINIGRYPLKRSKTKAGITIAAARKQAIFYSQQWQQGVDPKQYIEEQALAKELEKKKKEVEANRGTFKQLLEVYVNSMRVGGKASWEKVQEDLHRYVGKPFPYLMRMPARDIEPEHITKILARMADNGITTTMNRVRSYLFTAFKVGGQAYLNPILRTEQQINFGLKHNPVTLVPRQAAYERALDRHLSEAELQGVWGTMNTYMADYTALLFKLMFALGGQRPKEIIRASWECYDFTENMLVLPKEIVKNGRMHKVPLNSIALDILHELRELTGHCKYPFPRMKGREFVVEEHVRLDSLSRSTRRLVAGTGMKHFTPRDIRRTCKTLMGKIGLEKEIRDRIHNHALTDVSTRHYDRYDYAKEKRNALDRWDTFMRSVIEPGSNVREISRYAG